jgi:hypothetical protein
MPFRWMAAASTASTMPDRLRLNFHGGFVPQGHAHVRAAGFPSSAIGIVQGVWHVQQQATMRVIGCLYPAEFNIVESPRTFRTFGGFLADRKTPAADLKQQYDLSMQCYHGMAQVRDGARLEPPLLEVDSEEVDGVGAVGGPPVPSVRQQSMPARGSAPGR